MRERHIIVIFLVLMLAQFVGTFSTEGITPLAPFYRDELGLSRTQVGSLTPAIFLGMGLLSVQSGRLVDILGTRMILTVGLLVIAASAFLFSVARVFYGAWAFALLGGLGYSVTQPSTVKGIVTWFPKRVQATMGSVKQAGVSLGAAGAAAALVPIASTRGWGEAVLLAGVLALAAAIVVLTGYPTREGETSDREPGKERAGAAFRLMAQNRNLRLLLATGPIRAAANYCVAAYLVLFLVESASLQPASAAGFLAVAQITGSVARIVWGAMSDTIAGGERKSILMVLSMVGLAGTLVFVSLPDRPASTILWLGTILLGAGLSGGAGLYSVSIAEACGGQSIGAVVGLSGALSCVGVVVGPLAFG